MGKLTEADAGKGAQPLPAATQSLAERWLDTAAVGAVCILCLTISVAVITRALWRSVIPDEVQWVELMMILIILGPLAATFALRMSIEVEVFTNWAGARLRRILALLGHLVGLVFLTFLTWAGWRQFRSAWETGEYYKGVVDIPNWIGTGLFVLCLGIALLRLLAMFWFDLRAKG